MERMGLLEICALGSLIIAVIGLAVLIIRLNNSFLKEHQQLLDKTSDMKANFENYTKQNDLEISSIKTEVDCVSKESNKKMEVLKSFHETDMEKMKSYVDTATNRVYVEFKSLYKDLLGDIKTILNNQNDMKNAMTRLETKFELHERYNGSSGAKA